MIHIHNTIYVLCSVFCVLCSRSDGNAQLYPDSKFGTNYIYTIVAITRLAIELGLKSAVCIQFLVKTGLPVTVPARNEIPYNGSGIKTVLRWYSLITKCSEIAFSVY